MQERIFGELELAGVFSLSSLSYSVCFFRCRYRTSSELAGTSTNDTGGVGSGLKQGISSTLKRHWTLEGESSVFSYSLDLSLTLTNINSVQVRLPCNGCGEREEGKILFVQRLIF